MKTSELIQKLTSHLEEHGDGDVGAQLLDTDEECFWHYLTDIKPGGVDVELIFRF